MLTDIGGCVVSSEEGAWTQTLGEFATGVGLTVHKGVVGSG